MLLVFLPIDIGLSNANAKNRLSPRAAISVARLPLAIRTHERVLGDSQLSAGIRCALKSYISGANDSTSLSNLIFS